MTMKNDQTRLAKLLRHLSAGLAILAAAAAFAAADASRPAKILGMYVHQHWAYNHPYAARTWTLEDWRGYLDGLHKLGYNMVLIWPMLETMPDPLTSSDEANITKIAAVIDMAHHDFGMRASIVLCPNVSAKNEEARKYNFEKRPFFHTDDRVDPADPVAFGKLMAWREQLFRPLAKADGLFIIDSDPGGYANSTNLDFVYLLGAHRRMLDRLRPGIEVVYWSHFGWESYSRFYATGEMKRGDPVEPREAIVLLASQPRSEPWGVANSGFPADFLDSIGMGDRVLGFPYGTIESEPSFPFTIYGGDDRVSAGGRQLKSAYLGGQSGGQRGVIGNSQTHCVQLPNLFAFARAAQGLPAKKADFIAFANELIPGHGELIVEGWDALQGADAHRMETVMEQLDALPASSLNGGPLKGLLFGNSSRFIGDLVMQLHAASTLFRFRAAVSASPRDEAKITETFGNFVTAIAAWQQKHGYGNFWRWQPMEEALRKLDAASVNAVLGSRTFVSPEGATPFERVKNGFARLEDYSPRLIEAMKQALAERDKIRK